MPAADSSEPNRPARSGPPKRDPRLDAKLPAGGKSLPGRASPARDAAQATPEIPIAGAGLAPRRQVPDLRQLILIGTGAGVFLLVTIIGWAVLFRGRVTEGNSVPAVAPAGAGVGAVGDAGDANERRAPQRPVKCRITTPEPGFVAFVDEHPVLDAQGKIVPTPCEVEIEMGRHVIRVGKRGWNDIPRVVDVTAATDFDQEPTYEPFAELSTAFAAPYLNAPVGQPIPLESLQLSGRCQDPFVSANGREIWYAGSGPEGMGLYYATRRTSYDEWEAPSLLVLSRGADLPASPSATTDGLLVGYTVPGKVGRVWGLSRKSEEEAFDNKKPLFYAERGDPEWPSAQLSADGKRLYWLENRVGQTASWMATRYELEVEFTKPKKFSLPGGHPCLSSDELRQYVFDGKLLQRARRLLPTDPFSAPQIIAEPHLPDYVPHPDRRQFWVTDDEQWLYYAVDPATSGKLFVVRLNPGPGRGVMVVGRALKLPKIASAKQDTPTTPSPAIKPDPGEPQPAEVDSRSLPTAYAAFQKKLTGLIAKRDLAAAAKLITEGQRNPQLRADRELLQWDSEEVAALQKFWAAVEQAAASYKPDDPIRIGGSGFTVEKYEAGIFKLKAKTKRVERKLSDLSPGDLLAQADKIIPKTDSAGQLAIGIFLHFEGKGQAQALKVRFERTAGAGEEFLEHLAVRRLKIIEHELARENLGLALQQIDELAAAFPQSPSTAVAEQHRAKIYSYVKWEERGSRQWQHSAKDSSYTANFEKQPGSLLVSSTSYDNFKLSLEWRTISPTGQGGVYFRYPGQGKALDTAFKVHLANDAGVSPDKFCTGSLFNYYPPLLNAAKPGGQWNTLTLQVRGEQTVVTINGKMVVDALAIDAAVPKEGFVALDGEFGGIVYRKILLVEGVSSPAK